MESITGPVWQQGAMWKRNARAASGRVSLSVGRPIRFTDAMGYVWTQTYDVAGRPLSQIDALGAHTTNSYDSAGRLHAVIEPTAFINTLTYDLVDRLISVGNVFGQITTASYDAVNRLLSVTDIFGHPTTYGYDSAGRLNIVRNRRGAITSLIYDAASRPIAQVDALGFRTSFGYDAADRPTVQIDALSLRTSLQFDALGQLTGIQDPRGLRTTLSYTATGLLSSFVQPTGANTRPFYDAAGQCIAVMDSLGRITIAGYDAMERQISQQDARGLTSTLQYDANGNPLAFIDALGHRTTATYNALGSLIAEQDALGARTTIVRNIFDRTLAVCAPDGTLTTIGHTRATNFPLNIQQPSGQITSYVPFDEFNPVVFERFYPNGDSVIPAIDPEFNVYQVHYSDGRRVTNTYDPLNQLTKKVDWSGTTTLVYDALGRLSSIVDPLSGALAYAYDVNGNRGVSAFHTGVLTYTWDINNRLSQITMFNGQVSTIAYDALGRPARESLDGRARDHATDTVGNPVLERLFSSTGALQACATATYDAAANRLSIVELDGTRTSYAYDAKNQLTREHRTGTSPFNMGYSYDSVGNRITQTNDGLITSLSYLAGSLLHVITAPDGGKMTFSFDVNGNRISEQSSAGITTYLWQAENVLAGVQLPDGTITTNLYAPNGMRRKTSTGTESTIFVWDGENILRDFNTDDTQQALYIGAPDDLRYLIGMQRGANSYLAGLDLQGSVNRLLDASNAITDSYLTTAFGQEIASNGSTVNPFQFEGLFGYHREAVNRHLVRFRDLDTTTGSFLKLDPMVFFGGENNWYDYVGNNPGNWLDPLGPDPLRPYEPDYLLDPFGQVPPSPDWFSQTSTGKFVDWYFHKKGKTMVLSPYLNAKYFHSTSFLSQRMKWIVEMEKYVDNYVSVVKKHYGMIYIGYKGNTEVTFDCDLYSLGRSQPTVGFSIYYQWHPENGKYLATVKSWYHLTDYFKDPLRFHEIGPRGDVRGGVAYKIVADNGESFQFWSHH